jgi:hypothetical protein
MTQHRRYASPAAQADLGLGSIELLVVQDSTGWSDHGGRIGLLAGRRQS